MGYMRRSKLDRRVEGRVSIQQLGYIKPGYLWVNGLKVLLGLTGRVDHVGERPIYWRGFS